MHSFLKTTIRASRATWLVFFAFLALSLAPLLAGEPAGNGDPGGRRPKAMAPNAPGGEGGVVNTPALYIPHDLLPGPARSTGNGETFMNAQGLVGRQGLTIALLPNLGRLLVTVQSVSEKGVGPAVAETSIREGEYHIDRATLEKLAGADLATRVTFFRPENLTMGREAGHLCIDISPMQSNGLVSYRVFYNPVRQ